MNPFRRRAPERRQTSPSGEACQRQPVEIMALDGVPMLRVSSGVYEFPDQRGKHVRITLDTDFWVDVSKVTSDAFCLFVRQEKCYQDVNRELLRRGVDPWCIAQPIRASYDEAAAFAAWVGKRLLTTDQWTVFAWVFGENSKEIGHMVTQVRLHGPFEYPGEWCQGSVVRGRATPRTIPDFAGKYTCGEGDLNAIRCCREER